MLLKIKMFETRTLKQAGIDLKTAKKQAGWLQRAAVIIAVSQGTLGFEGRAKFPAPTAIAGKQTVIDQMGQSPLQKKPVTLVAPSDLNLCDAIAKLP